MKQRKNFIKSDNGISTKLRELTQFGFKSGKSGWLKFIYTCYSVCVSFCVFVCLCVCLCVCVCVGVDCFHMRRFELLHR